MAERTYRQGDILLIQRDVAPEGFEVTEKGRIVVAEGEVTGHEHAVENAELLTRADTELRFLQIMETSGLKHDEHATIDLDPGVYEIRHQNEFEPGPFEAPQTRRVAD